MISIIHKIIENRNSGVIRIGYVKVYPSDSIQGVAERLGLKGNDGIYIEISRKFGIDILRRILSRDMAHGVSFDIDNESMDGLISGYDNATWYSNAKKNEYTAINEFTDSPSWNPATGSTFDMGVIIRHDNVALCIWVEDED